MQPTVEEIKAYLAEDIGSGDLTAELIPHNRLASAKVQNREPMVLCGQTWFAAVFYQLNPEIDIQWYHQDGDIIAANSQICKLSGSARALLSGERCALNLLQTLSATATMARKYADAVAGTQCKVLDTRKTIPGLRLAQKYAVRCGGCFNHRFGLYDAILIKENHILAAGSITQAIQSAKQLKQGTVEIEVENLYEFQEALHNMPDRILLDNFSIADTLSAVQLNCKPIELEASGNIDLTNIRTVAETGVDFISIGALTKNLSAIDLSMRIEMLSTELTQSY
jgi:nicotinate-nucleotide pyrophosphorylase (carboxylating)